MPNCSRWNNSKAPAASLARIGPAMTYLMWIPWSCPKRCGCNVLLPPYTHHINTWNQSQSFSQSFPWQVALYCTGFPCTPYSRLHANSQLLGEEAAKPMWKCIQNIRDARPAVSCHQCTMSLLQPLCETRQLAINLRLACWRTYEGSHKFLILFWKCWSTTCPSNMDAWMVCHASAQPLCWW